MEHLSLIAFISSYFTTNTTKTKLNQAHHISATQSYSRLLMLWIDELVLGIANVI